MRIFKAYVRSGRPVRYGDMMERYGLSLISIDSDRGGAYLKFEAPEHVKARRIERYRGVRDVIEYDTSHEGSFTSARVHLRKRNMIDCEDLSKETGTCIKCIGEDKRGAYMDLDVPLSTPMRSVKKYIKGVRMFRGVEILQTDLRNLYK
jgi:hypothetical protein